MGLIRIIIISLIVYLVIQIFKRWTANKVAQNTQKNEQQQIMVKCDVCQLHIPQDEAIEKQDKYYCSKEHADQQ